MGVCGAAGVIDNWTLYNVGKPARYVHVVPNADPEHRVEIDPACWCEPTLDLYDDGSVLVLHRDALARRLGLSAKILAENVQCA